MSTVDDISPSYVGEQRIVLSLSDTTTIARAFTPVDIDVDYSACMPEGVMLPLEMTVTGPSSNGQPPSFFLRKIFARRPPRHLTFQPIEGGLHLVVLKEPFHNLWFGSLELHVTGDRLLVAARL